jgi:lipopolysaccharide biosynthesis glycosyltransferase
MINVWIGCDQQFAKNIPIEARSISKNAKLVYIRFLYLEHMKELTRVRDPNQSTDSAFTRWMIPYLAGYKGWHLYLDSDMMVCDSLEKLWELRDSSKAVMVVKHNIKHAEGIKFNKQPQKNYTRKNWSSVMLFNAEKCQALTPDYINTAHGLDLHQFKWIDDELIGELPSRWNHLVGVNEPNDDPGIVHWTLGGPWAEEYKDTEHSKLWNTLGK